MTSDLTRLREIAEAATAGEWVVEDPMAPLSLWIVQGGKQTYEWWPIAVCDMPDEDDHLFTGSEVHANATFIATFHPQAVLELLDRVEGQNAAATKALQHVLGLLETAKQAAVFTKPQTGRVIVNVAKLEAALDDLRQALTPQRETER